MTNMYKTYTSGRGQILFTSTVSVSPVSQRNYKTISFNRSDELLIKQPQTFFLQFPTHSEEGVASMFFHAVCQTNT